MSEAHGVESWIGLGVESTYGTSVARTIFTEMLSESIELKQGRVNKPTLRGVSKSRYIKKKKSVEGGFEVQMTTEGLELLLKHAFGSVVTTGPTGSPSRYTHNFSLAKTLPTGLTVEVNRDSVAIGGSSSDVYAGCQISKLTFKQTAEEALIISADLIGKDGAFAAVSTPTFPAVNLLGWEDFSLLLAPDGVTFGAIDVIDFELTLDNNLAADRYKLGQLSRKGLGRGGHRTVTGKITKEFDSLAERNYFRTLAQGHALRGLWTCVADSSSARLLRLDVANLEWMGGDPKADSEGILSLPMEFEARISAAEGDELSGQLFCNTVSIP